jgi:hypothetical protein
MAGVCSQLITPKQRRKDAQQVAEAPCQLDKKLVEHVEFIHSACILNLHTQLEPRRNDWPPRLWSSRG